MKKNEIWLANLNPSMGNEQSGIRPVVIISGNGMNANLNMSIICPLTTKIKNFIGDIILEPDDTNGLKETSEILSFQIRVLTHKRFIKKLGLVTDAEMNKIIENINKIFKY